MKIKRTIIVTAILCVLLTISVFAIISSAETSIDAQPTQNGVDLYLENTENVDNALTLQSDGEGDADVSEIARPIRSTPNGIAGSLENAVVDNIMTLRFNYESYGESYEIIRHITVATDSEFRQVLEWEHGDWHGGDWREYIFKLDGREQIDTIYIRPAIIYIPTEIVQVSMPVALNASMSNTLNGSSQRGVNDSWFSIYSMDVDNIEYGLYRLSIMITPYTADFPRFPTLMIGGRSYSGAVGTRFNEEGDLDLGRFTFRIQATDAETVWAELRSATIAVEEALLRADSTSRVSPTVEFSSNAESAIDIIVVD
ncbi:MAG: hypothetical protein FWC75_06615 [Oscillospiraceae bacterium]|nr:hypothetical protein [Oscillospiraceae bacterium]